MATIDRLDWHCTNEYPKDLPLENAGIHIGMYLAWIIINDLIGEIHLESEQSISQVNKVKNREITGLDFLISECDEKFWENDLNELGLQFTNFYYESEKSPSYFIDYAKILSDNVETIYHVENSWKNYDKLSKKIDKRFKAWNKTGEKKWWQIFK